MISIHQLKITDLSLFRQMILLFGEVFEEPVQIPADEYLTLLLKKKSFAAFVAVNEGEVVGGVVGGITVHEMPGYYSEISELYIYDLAVSPNWQRNGIGKKLVKAVEDYARKLNIKTIFVQTYSTEKEAIDFYRNVVGEGQDIVHFELIIKDGEK